MSGNTGRSGIWLTTADADAVVSAGDDGMAVLGHHAQAAVLQLEVNLLACARIEMNALESAESDLGRTRDQWELQIKLHDLIAR